MNESLPGNVPEALPWNHSDAAALVGIGSTVNEPRGESFFAGDACRFLAGFDVVRRDGLPRLDLNWLQPTR